MLLLSLLLLYSQIQHGSPVLQAQVVPQVPLVLEGQRGQADRVVLEDQESPVHPEEMQEMGYIHFMRHLLPTELEKQLCAQFYCIPLSLFCPILFCFIRFSHGIQHTDDSKR